MLLLLGAGLASRIRLTAFSEAVPDLPPGWHIALQAESADGLHFEVAAKPLASPADTQHPGFDPSGRELLFYFDADSGELTMLDIANGRSHALLMGRDCDPTVEPARHCVDPCWVPLADGSQRLYYVRTPDQGDPALALAPTEIHSARSVDGQIWEREPGVRLVGRGIVDPDVVPLEGGGFRMYYTTLPSGPDPHHAGPPGVYSALSTDGLRFESEPGQRLLDASATATVTLPGGGFRTYYHSFEPGLRSAHSSDGLVFEPDPGLRIPPDPLPGHRWLAPEAPALLRRPNGSLWMVFSATPEPLFPLNLLAAVRHAGHDRGRPLLIDQP